MFAGLFGSNTPQYKGPAQPHAQSRGGMFGLITGLFAPSAPAYAHPRPEPVVPASITPASPPSGEAPQEQNRSEEEPSGATEPQGKRITIIVKPGPGTSVEEVVQFLQDRCLDN